MNLSLYFSSFNWICIQSQLVPTCVRTSVKTENWYCRVFFSCEILPIFSTTQLVLRSRFIYSWIYFIRFKIQLSFNLTLHFILFEMRRGKPRLIIYRYTLHYFNLNMIWKWRAIKKNIGENDQYTCSVWIWSASMKTYNK